MKIYNITGGIGRQIAFTAVISKIPEKIYVLSPYPDIFQFNPNVDRVLSPGMPYLWNDYITKYDIVTPEPYLDNDFIHKKIHLIEAFCRECKVEYEENMLPEITLLKSLDDDAEKFLKDHKKFIIVQFTGGQPPFGEMKEKFNQKGQHRNYPEHLAQKLVNLIHDKYSDLAILNMSLPNEYKLDHTIQIAAPYLFYVALLKRCITFVGIDSSLNHMSACAEKKGIVMWFGTSPVHFGYKQNINLSGNCKFNDIHCSRPYVRDFGDMLNGQPWECHDPVCQLIEPEKVMEELCRLIPK